MSTTNAENIGSIKASAEAFEDQQQKLLTQTFRAFFQIMEETPVESTGQPGKRISGLLWHINMINMPNLIEHFWHSQAYPASQALKIGSYNKLGVAVHQQYVSGREHKSGIIIMEGKESNKRLVINLDYNYWTKDDMPQDEECRWYLEIPIRFEGVGSKIKEYKDRNATQITDISTLKVLLVCLELAKGYSDAVKAGKTASAV